MFDTDEKALSVFKTVCKENDIIFVDITEDFEELFENERRLPYGFINTEVGKGHLNKYGHRVIAERLRDVILSQEEKGGEM